MLKWQKDATSAVKVYAMDTLYLYAMDAMLCHTSHKLKHNFFSLSFFFCLVFGFLMSYVTFHILVN